MINKRINSERRGEGDKNCITNAGISCKSNHEHLCKRIVQWHRGFTITCAERGKETEREGKKKRKLKKKIKKKKIEKKKEKRKKGEKKKR